MSGKIPKRNKWGMTPRQIREAFNQKRPQESRQKSNPHSVSANPQTKPIKVARLSSTLNNNKVILDTPVACLKPCVFYKTPEWFEKKDKADISIIIPLFKSHEVIKRLIDSWDFEDNTEIIFVDDACPYYSRDVVVQHWATKNVKKPIGRILYSPENQGFGSSCNLGASVATGDYLIFLNADTVATPGWIRPIVRQLRKDDVGIVGNMQLKKINHKDTIDSAGSEWIWEHSAFQHTGRDYYNGIKLPHPFSIDNCPKEIFEIQEREMVTGACFGIRKELFNEIGGFNPNYRIAYWEDAEMCMSIKELGFKIIYQPNSRIYHEGHHSEAGGHKFHAHNRSYFINKWVTSGRIDKLVKQKRPNDKPEIRNILIRRQAAHGDVLIAAAIAPALKKMYPNCKISFSTFQPDVLKDNPHIDKIVDENTVGERSFQIYYNLDMTYECRPNTNILKAYADTVGVKPEDCELFLATEPVEELPEEYIVIHSGTTNWVGRNWSPPKFDILAAQLQQQGHKIVCVGNPRDNRPACDLDLRGKTTTQQLAHVVKNAKMFIGIDSFPMHIAQTFSVPGVCFFGSIKPELRLIGKSIIPVCAKNLSCLGCHHRQPAPCVSTVNCETQFLDCINLVTVQQMMDAVQEVLKSFN